MIEKKHIIIVGLTVLALGVGAFVAFAADTGFHDPSANGEDHTQWDTAGNAYTSNNSDASENTSNHLHDFYNFAFGIPAGATIDGIEVVLEAAQNEDFFGDHQIGVELSWDGGTSYTSTGNHTGNLTLSDADYTIGGAANTWGRTWSDTEFSDANFRMRVNSRTMGLGQITYLDDIDVKVYYTEAAAGGSVTGEASVDVGEISIDVGELVID